VNTIVADNDLPSSPVTVFLGSLFFNLAIGAILFVVLGGRKLVGRKVTDEEAPEPTEPDTSAAVSGHGASAGSSVDTLTATAKVTVEQVLTLVGLAALVLLALVFDLDIGFVSITIATVLALFSAARHKGAVMQISWTTVLLIAGVLTYVSVLRAAGTIEYVGESVTSIGAPLLVALLLAYIGAVVSAFASSTAIIGVAISLAVPFLLAGEIGAVGVVVALAVSATIVDVSPFSTNGALVLANAQDVDRDRFYKQILGYSGVVVLVGPLIAWLVFVVPGWL